MGIREDQRRFRDIVRGRIKQNFQKYVTHGEMIGKREREFVKIPVPSIDLPRFKYGSKQAGGVGQGAGEAGDGVDGEPKPGQGEAGDAPGEHTLETEVSLDELADILGQELALPRIEPRGDRNVATQAAKYTGRAMIGPDSLRHFKSSYKEALKRSLASGTFDPANPYVVPIKRDLRFRSSRVTTQPRANAVVIYMMDVSGSMGEDQKEIVRLESFWINAWLRRHYKGLETRFIVHDAVAREVDEKTFFATSESGGTLISSAYQLTKKIIDADYPPRDWNIYLFHFSDGRQLER